MTTNLLTWIDYALLLGYMILIAGIGLYFTRRQGSAEDYFTAKVKIPGWVMGISLFASTLSSFTFIAFPGWAYDGNWEVLIREYMSGIAFVFSAFVLIPLYRQIVRMSVFEYLEARFSTFARVYSSAGVLLLAPIGFGIIIYVMCLAVNSITGWNIHTIIVVVAVITVVYTLFGGIEGVIWTELIQGLLFMGSGVLVVVYLLFFAGSSPSELLQVATSSEKFKLAEPSFSMTEQTVWLMLWAGMFHWFNTFAAAPAQIQRYLITPDLKQAIRGTAISTLCCMFTWASFLLIGTLLWAYYHLFPERMREDIANQGDKVLPYFMGSELPTGIAGLILAGVCASAMSGVSSGINSTAACFMSDFHDRFAKNNSDRRRLIVSKACVLVYGVAALAIALALTRWEGGMMKFAFDIANLAGSILAGGGLAMFMLGIMTWRTTAKGLYVGLGAGLVFALWASTSHMPDAWAVVSNLPLLNMLPKYEWHAWWIMGISNVIVFVVAYVASYFVGRRNPDRSLTIYGLLKNRKQVEGGEGPQPA